MFLGAYVRNQKDKFGVNKRPTECISRKDLNESDDEMEDLGQDDTVESPPEKKKNERLNILYDKMVQYNKEVKQKQDVTNPKSNNGESENIKKKITEVDQKDQQKNKYKEEIEQIDILDKIDAEEFVEDDLFDKSDKGDNHHQDSHQEINNGKNKEDRTPKKRKPKSKLKKKKKKHSILFGLDHKDKDSERLSALDYSKPIYNISMSDKKKKSKNESNIKYFTSKLYEIPGPITDEMKELKEMRSCERVNPKYISNIRSYADQSALQKNKSSAWLQVPGQYSSYTPFNCNSNMKRTCIDRRNKEFYSSKIY